MLACNAREDYFDDGKVEADKATPATEPLRHCPESKTCISFRQTLKQYSHAYFTAYEIASPNS